MHNVAVEYLVRVSTFDDLIFLLNFKIFVLDDFYDFSISSHFNTSMDLIQAT